MSYRERQSQSRDRYLATYDAEEASRYDVWVRALALEDHTACLADLEQSFAFTNGMSVLDAGAGTGALCLTLSQLPGLKITALEPCSAMRDLLASKPELSDVEVVPGFCDSAGDRAIFAAKTFDVIASRMLANCLFDPIAAFRNWHCWLRSGGTVILIDGLFDRADWSGRWEGVVDTLPLSACRTVATVPYLLEQAEFRIRFAGMMQVTNSLPSTRTPRYLVVATRDGG